MSAGHTPGPWVAKYAADGCGDIGIVAGGPSVGRGRVVIAEVFAAIEREDERSEQSLPNGRLISAAPDLLAALQALDNACCADLEDRENRITFRKALISGRAAISKALGGWA